MKSFWVKLIGTGMGIGYFPKMPGTVGSFFALVLYWIFFPQEASVLIHVVFFVIILLASGAGVWAGTEAEKLYGEDPSCVVIDEMAGMWVALFLLPKSPVLALAAFVLFRIFDIFKWLGCNAMQRLRGGWGIMMDDLLAGFWTNLILQVILFVINRTETGT